MKTLPLLLATSLFAASASSYAEYRLTTLMTPDAEYIDILGINNAGQLSGNVKTSDGAWHATRWDQGVATYLTAPWGSETGGHRINEAGQVGGYAYDSVNERFTPVIWSGNTASALENLPGKGALVSGLNDNGEAVGYVFNSGIQAVYWKDGQANLLAGHPTLNFTQAVDISNSGMIAGHAGMGTPIVWENGSVKELPLVSGYTYVRNLSNGDYVVGAGSSSSVVWNLTKGTIHTVPLSFLTGINDDGVAVGSINGRPSLWQDGRVTDLSYQLESSLRSQGWVLTSVGLINDLGVITGTAQLEGKHYSVLLTPIPEPGTAALMLMGLTVFAAARRRSIRANHNRSGVMPPSP